MAQNSIFSAGIGNKNSGTNTLSRTPVYKNFVQDASNSSIYKQYYSTLDGEIYLGNTYIEDLVDIAWTIQQQQLPIFGYNSHIYDEIALGSRIISGTLVINFTSPNFLNEVIRTASKVSLAASSTIARDKTANSITSTVYTTDKTVRAADDHNPIWVAEKAINQVWPSFDIDIVFGGKTSLGGDTCHIILEGCHIGVGNMVMSSNADVAREQYSFVARDIRNIS